MPASLVLAESARHSSAQGNVRPSAPRAARSHSASLGNVAHSSELIFPALRHASVSHVQYAIASCQLTWRAGWLRLSTRFTSGESHLRRVVPTKRKYCSFVTRYLLIL